LAIIRQQESLVEILRAQGRATAGAELLLATFKQAAAAITEHRQYLEGRVIFLAREAARSKASTGLHGESDMPAKHQWATEIFLWLADSKKRLFH
jgi:hypothetical protein